MEPVKHTVWGISTFHAETGSEGGWWAVQDARGIDLDSEANTMGGWSYYGLLILQDGDELTIYDREDVTKVLWTGTIDQEPLGLFTDDAFGMWIHTDQRGIERETWAMWFMKSHPTKLVTTRKPWVVGRLTPTGDWQGIFQSSLAVSREYCNPIKLNYWSDGSITSSIDPQDTGGRRTLSKLKEYLVKD